MSMDKYVFVYYEGTGSGEASSAEDWGKWFGELGDKIIDPGNPFNHGGKAVHGGGIMDVEGPAITGYTIVKASSMEEATALAQNCPLVAISGSSVCVYEALPM